MNPKKYLLAKSLYRRYEQFGYNDRRYKMYSKIANLAANILHKNGLTSWL